MTAQLLQLETAPDLVDQVYRALLDAISAGALAPGQRITQEELAERLAVSRQPVMQALRLLKRDGFVQDAPLAGNAGRCRGLQVAPLDPAWIAQVYEVRGALDTLAARLAAERRAHLDPALIEQGRQAVEAGDIKAMIDADLAFHRALYQASANPLIEQSALLHWHHIRRAMGEALQHDGLRDPVWDEHTAIAQAVAQGDAEHAEALMREHSHQASLYLGAQAAPAASAPSPDNSVVR
ncbi:MULTISPECIES: GntR family transcriptional regulator [unclassified Hydrogenophaga]|jgi:DNA-binding GntR family transcriptional regulator|uniref:GntR family transcriptional regulator n=1 Tax=unclassified Hydrogenophaga TaxID=2610897 RepID=UPI0009A327CB|nr:MULTISPECIES: GntR family transcriptional regulator [unclassified Hydrogenophaga]OPF63264.1 GntR family transcriptional regulator [Hydrogenophaga sp. H7]